MKFLQQLRASEKKDREARCNQPQITSDQFYAQMDRVMRSTRASSQELRVKKDKKMPSRIQEMDMFYAGFWIILMSGLVGSVVWMLVLIERNTRKT